MGVFLGNGYYLLEIQLVGVNFIFIEPFGLDWYITLEQ